MTIRTDAIYRNGRLVTVRGLQHIINICIVSMCTDNFSMFRFPSLHFYFSPFSSYGSAYHFSPTKLQSTTPTISFVCLYVKRCALRSKEHTDTWRESEWANGTEQPLFVAVVCFMLFVRSSSISSMVSCVSLQTRWLNIEGSTSSLEVLGMHLRLRIFTLCFRGITCLLNVVEGASLFPWRFETRPIYSDFIRSKFERFVKQNIFFLNSHIICTQCYRKWIDRGFFLYVCVIFFFCNRIEHWTGNLCRCMITVPIFKKKSELNFTNAKYYKSVEVYFSHVNKDEEK